MKNLIEMTPIELNLLVNKVKEDHEMVKKEILTLLDDVKTIEEKINSKLINLENLETKYVEIMEILMSK